MTKNTPKKTELKVGSPVFAYRGTCFNYVVDKNGQIEDRQEWGLRTILKRETHFFADDTYYPEAWYRYRCVPHMKFDTDKWDEGREDSTEKTKYLYEYEILPNPVDKQCEYCRILGLYESGKYGER